ncbi:MAG TPA: hypothetical protein VMZ91_09870 [Candidatus Paceibacterota bacterium]|nr:hypothetical protein [Candidatus Paceibacterota bacterium]
MLRIIAGYWMYIRMRHITIPEILIWAAVNIGIGILIGVNI